MNNEPWYERRVWWNAWGYGGYLLLLLILAPAIAAFLGWSYLFWHLVDNYEWVYQIVWWLSYIPWAHLLIAGVVVGVTVAPCLYLCYLIHKRTTFGQRRPGTLILAYIAFILVSIGIGIIFGTGYPVFR